MTRDEIEALADAGAVFSREVDPVDPRYELVTIRRVNPALLGAMELPTIRLEGLAARARATKFALATACGIAQSLGRDDLLAKRIEKLARKLGVLG
jgi:hypothetical protein